jgi:SSS family solute:Na+ symporter
MRKNRAHWLEFHPGRSARSQIAGNVRGVLVLLQTGALASMVALMATRGLFSNDPIIYGMLVSLIVFVVVSLLTTRTSEERMRAWERRLEGPGTPS